MQRMDKTITDTLVKRVKEFKNNPEKYKIILTLLQNAQTIHIEIYYLYNRSIHRLNM